MSERIELYTARVRRNKQAIMDGILTSSDTRNTLTMAAYESERRAFTRPVIIGALRRRGLWPFNPDLTQANFRDNLGLAEMGETTVDAARRAAAEVIQAAQERVERAKAGSLSGIAVVKRGVVHSPFLLLKQQREMDAETAKVAAAKQARREEREQKREDQERLSVEKSEAMERRRCRVCAGKVYRGGKQWTNCNCDALFVCPGCAKSLAACLALGKHLKVCEGGGGGESGSESGSVGGESVARDSE